MKTVVAIRHVPFEDLGSFSEPLIEQGYRYCQLDCRGRLAGIIIG